MKPHWQATDATVTVNGSGLSNIWWACAAARRADCTARRQDGKPCGSYAVRGGTVCRRHGGSAPQVRAAANRRLAAMALPAVGRLGHFAFDEITRHRLSRGGDRAANNALHRIALVRMSAHPQTRGYVQRQLANGRTNKEILRLLKRAIAREIFRLLTRRTRSTNTAAPYTAGGSWARCHRLHVGHRGSTTAFLHDAGRSL